jgi:hypothetical protein
LSREGSTIKDLLEHSKEQFPNTNGFETRSIERFCKENDIRRKDVVSDETLDVQLREQYHRLDIAFFI